MESALAEWAGVQKDDLPALIIMNFTDDMYKYKYEGDVRAATVDDMRDFIYDFERGKLEKYVKGEEAPKDNTDELTEVVTSTFNDIVMDSPNDVFIKFYAPWCGHCQDLAPIWLKLAEILEVVPDLTIAEIDSTENEIEELDITGYPTLLLFKNGDKEKPIEYEGERSLSKLLQFLKENSSAYQRYLAK